MARTWLALAWAAGGGNTWSHSGLFFFFFWLLSCSLLKRWVFVAIPKPGDSMLQTTRWGLCCPLLSPADFVPSLGNREETAQCGKHTVPWQVDSGYCRSEWCSAGVIFLEFNSLQMCWRAVQKWSPKNEGGLRGIILFGWFWVLCIFCFVFCFYFVFCCCFVCCFFFLVQTDLGKISSLLYISNLYWLEIASTRQSPMAQVIWRAAHEGVKKEKGGDINSSFS